jgi:hypothetical protein
MVVSVPARAANLAQMLVTLRAADASVRTRLCDAVLLTDHGLDAAAAGRDELLDVTLNDALNVHYVAPSV